MLKRFWASWGGASGNRRLFADEQREIGDKVDDELAVRPHRFPQPARQRRDLLLALAENLADKSLKGLRQGGVGDVALVLVELARRRKGRAAERAPCAVRSPPRICRCRNIRRPARAPACRWPRPGRKRRAAFRFPVRARKVSPGSAGGRGCRAFRAEMARCGHCSRHSAAQRSRSALRPSAVW